MLDVDLGRRRAMTVDEALRDDEATELFLARLLQGPAEVERYLALRAQTLWTLLDAEQVPDRALPALAASVGWGPQRPWVSSLDEAQLRRLVAAAIPLWRRRGSRQSWRDLVGLLAGRFAVVQDWFDRRSHTGMWGAPWMVPGLGELGEGGPYAYPERVSDIWTEDPDALLDFSVLAGMLAAFRPSGERINLYRAWFIDPGYRHGARWGHLLSSMAWEYDPTAFLRSTGTLFEARAGGTEATWAGYIADLRIRTAGVARIGIAYQSSSAVYAWVLDPDLGTVELFRGASSLGTWVQFFGADAWIRWRMTHEVTAADVTVRLYMEGHLVGEYVDSDPSRSVAGSVVWGSPGPHAVDAQGVLIFPVMPDRVRVGPTP